MFKPLTLATAVAMLATGVAAETHEIKMLNRGEKGAMVFEPAFVKAAPGDTVRFVPADKGHNVQSIEAMLPDGVESFKTKYNEEFVLTVEAEGVYGVKCTPHYGMGMVALIQAGEPVNLKQANAVEHRGKASAKFKGLFEKVQ
ncbi:MAG: pseudoazurin [Sediminimonas sp.]|uniref:pseudoazurin n=1 Tax=Sediminimonas sp. TaxID=2823379 RepID=UPI00286FBCCD|nr:pseudoazurin [Sediminimonas sp.]MDR9483920.1 pseudoazurin [Sediminimonas sp.]